MEFGFGTRGGFAVLVTAGVVGSGLANYGLTLAGFDILGSAAWAVGYGAMAVLLWYGWLRPLDIVGPDDTRRRQDRDGHPDAHDTEATDGTDPDATETGTTTHSGPTADK